MKLFETKSSSGQEQRHWFVNRREFRLDFLRRLQWQSGTLSNVVVYHGPGGIGKSTVRRIAIDDLLIPAKVPFAIVDFEPEGSARTPEQTFTEIRTALRKHHLHFTTFDLLWVRHWEETNHQRIRKELFPPELSDFATVLSVLPILGDFANLAQAMIALGNLSKSAADWISKRLNRGGLAQLEQMNARELLALMPEAMGNDLETMMQEKHHRGQDGEFRITLIFDGYERLDQSGVDDWFIRELCRSSGSTLKAIFGREILEWEFADPAWRRAIDYFPTLTNLSPRYATDYLERRGIKDPDLRRYLAELTDGFPYTLGLAADTANEIVEKRKRDPRQEDFAFLRDSNNLNDDLLRYLLREVEEFEQDAFILASIPRWFNPEILELLIAEPASVPRLFKKLTHYALSEPVLTLKNTYSIRKEARRLLREEAHQLKHWSIWNRELRDYHKSFSEGLDHLLEMLYHGFLCAPGETFEEFRREFQTALDAQQFSKCSALLQAVPAEPDLPVHLDHWVKLAKITLLVNEDEVIESAGTTRELIDSLLNENLEAGVRGRALRCAALLDKRAGRYAEARKTLQESIQFFEGSDDQAIRAKTYSNLGDVLGDSGSFRDAIHAYKTSIHILGELPGELPMEIGVPQQMTLGVRIMGQPLSDALKAIAGLYARTGRIELAVETFEEMLREGRSAKHLRTEAEALAELGLVYRRLGRLVDAESAYRQALPLMEQLRSVAGYGHVLCGLGMTLEQGAQFEQAKPQYDQSLQFFRQINDTYGQAKLYYCLARVNEHAKNFGLAQDLYQQSLETFRQREHVSTTGTLLLDWARLKTELGEFQEALTLCREAQGIFTDMSDRTGVANQALYMGNIYFSMGNPEIALVYWKNAKKCYGKLLRRKLPAIDLEEQASEDAFSPGEVTWSSWLPMYDIEYQWGVLRRLNRMIDRTEKKIANVEKDTTSQEILDKS